MSYIVGPRQHKTSKKIMSPLPISLLLFLQLVCISLCHASSTTQQQEATLSILSLIFSVCVAVTASTLLYYLYSVCTGGFRSSPQRFNRNEEENAQQPPPRFPTITHVKETSPVVYNNNNNNHGNSTSSSTSYASAFVGVGGGAGSSLSNYYTHHHNNNTWNLNDSVVESNFFPPLFLISLSVSPHVHTAISCV